MGPEQSVRCLRCGGGHTLQALHVLRHDVSITVHIHWDPERQLNV